jgi:hypothetical protein
LVVDIYEAAVDPTLWLDVLQALGQRFDGQQLIMFSVGQMPGDRDFFWASNAIPLEAQEDYSRYYWAHDPRNRRLLEASDAFHSGTVALDRDLTDPRMRLPTGTRLPAPFIHIGDAGEDPVGS